MSFTSQVFLLFCLLFYPVYFLSKGTRLNNYVIVVASCIFYGWWDWRFVILFGITTCFDFAAARLIGGEQNQQRRLTLVWASMAANLLMLGFFKYSNFLFANLNILFEPAGVSLGNWYLAVILPAGISFYTFQSMSYTIDVYRRKIAPSNSLIEFLAYVSFFPHMIAGPIQRSTHFLPQFRTERTFNIETATDGLRQIVWGLIKKVVIADNLAPLVEAVFEHPADAHGPQVLIGTVFFSFQIYCDFSGYSDIAIGLAKVMGFDLSRNFAYPYFSTSIQEFWRRWHISLTSWFREYVYQPLGGNHTTRARWIRNVALVFMLSGIWHGANWTFVAWGAIHGAAYLAFAPFYDAAGKRDGLGWRLAGWFGTMAVVHVGWIFFRAQSISAAFDLIGAMFRAPDWLVPSHYYVASLSSTVTMVSLIIVLFGLEWLGRHHAHPLQLPSMNQAIQGAAIVVGLFSIALLGAERGVTFVYFQF